MKNWIFLLAFLINGFFSARSDATPPLPPGLPSAAPVEAVVNKYVDKDFIQEQLAPPEKCNRYSEKLMFAYDWKVVLTNIGRYDQTHKLLPVKATIIVRCGPFRSSAHPSGKEETSEWPLRTETPIDFQLIISPPNSQT